MKRRLFLRLGFVAVAALVALATYNGSFSNRSRIASEAKRDTFHSKWDGHPCCLQRRANPAAVSSADTEPVWLTDVQNDPDPRVRLNAIEAYARTPGESLDPFTHVLVDPDEGVRTRAQELLEEALARRR